MISIAGVENADMRAKIGMKSQDYHLQKQNVVHGTNYIVPGVSNFVISARKSDFRRVERNTKADTNTKTSKKPHLEETPDVHNEFQSDGKIRNDAIVNPSSQTQISSLKRPRRELKRSVALEKNQVRYLVSEVPQVNRNQDFLRLWRDKDRNNLVSRVSSNLSVPRCNVPCRTCTSDAGHDCMTVATSNQAPFINGNSVLWIPLERHFWEDSLSEMNAVCTSAALRRHVATLGKATTQTFSAPLSREYIRDRVDIDDPLNGFQIRHTTGGWLQGFVMFTTFTTWSHYFKWDSLHPSSGLRPQAGMKLISEYYDDDGSMALELDAQPRCGDPLAGGIAFSSIAEISLLGGLGCGEYLLRMALDDIMSKGHYKFVVLQATNSSIAFYERFGFIRVGAVSRYGGEKITKRVIRNPEAVLLSDVIGYRHWTYAHESERSLGKHGGPSYMMALRLPERSRERTENELPSFLQVMKKYAVEMKPKISPVVGVSTTPAGKKATVEQFSVPPTALPLTTSAQANVSRKRGTSSRLQGTFLSGSPTTILPILGPPSTASKTRNATTETAVSKKDVSPCKASQRIHLVQMPNLKRMRTSAPITGQAEQLSTQRFGLLAPPPEGQALSYNQKQYQSPWLAVPPAASSPICRPPPRSRSPFTFAMSVKKRKINEESVILADKRLLALEKSVLKRRSSDASREEEKKEEHPSDRYIVYTTPTRSPPSKVNRKAKTAKTDNRFFSYRKQRIMTMPKHIPRAQQFFNKVVKQNGSKEKKYWFVLHYDHEQGLMRLIPLGAQGLLSGKREGRSRWKALVKFSDVNVQTVQPSKYEIVPAFMVTKTPMVELETWDIFE